jgi:hypothetical protein
MITSTFGLAEFGLAEFGLAEFDRTSSAPQFVSPTELVKPRTRNIAFKAIAIAWSSMAKKRIRHFGV